MPFIPHTSDETAAMLEAIGESRIDDLFDEIPKNLLINSLPGVPVGMCEADITRLMGERALRNVSSRCFGGWRLRAPYSGSRLGNCHSG